MTRSWWRCRIIWKLASRWTPTAGWSCFRVPSRCRCQASQFLQNRREFVTEFARMQVEDGGVQSAIGNLKSAILREFSYHHARRIDTMSNIAPRAEKESREKNHVSSDSQVTLWSVKS